MPDDVIINKVASLERCIGRIRTVYSGTESNLYQDLTTQDSILLNLQRACEVSIDLAMHVVRKRKLGVPQDSRDAFEILHVHALIAEPLATAMKRMVGFRNVAIHEYDKLNLDIVKSIIATKLDDILMFGKQLLRSES
ncbi:MAG: type VII toxin-antitoxin system HepT family RNase toxin [Nitrospiraceae bacterium]